MKNRNKKYYQTLLLILTLLTAYSLQLNATVRYVSKTGSSTPPYTSWETAADSIQKCINICFFGDTIYVANGVYEEQVVMIPGLSLIGAGADSCWIDTRNLVTSQNYRCVQTANNSLFTGFCILTYSNSTWGIGIAVNGNSLVTLNKVSRGRYGILNGSNAIIYKNIFENVSQGLHLINSNALIRNNSIYTDPNSQATIIAGLYINAFDNNYLLTIDSNYIVTQGDGIDKSFGSRVIIRINTIILNSIGARGIYLGYSDSAWVCNNLIYAIEGWRGIDNSGVPHLYCYNNYMFGHFDHPQNSTYVLTINNDNVVKNNVVIGSERGVEAEGTQNLVFQYNNIWNNDINYYGFTPDTTNISVDPMIVNSDSTQGELDFRLQMFSPLIDAGDPDILDKDGSRSDIGLYGGPYGESYTYQDLAPKPPRGLYAEVADSTITLTWQKNTEADFNHYNLYRDTTSNFSIDTTKLVSSLTDTFYLHIIPQEVERLYFKLTGVDNQGNESNPSEEVAVILVSVKNEWKPVNNYILYQNYPNPFNPITRIGYKLKKRGYVKLYVYDVKGELVEVLVNQTQEAGYYEVEFNGEGKTELIGVKNPFVSGVYLCQIIVQNEKGIPVFSNVMKMVFLK